MCITHTLIYAKYLICVDMMICMTVTSKVHSGSLALREFYGIKRIVNIMVEHREPEASIAVISYLHAAR